MIQAYLKFIASNNRTDPFIWTGENIFKGIPGKFTPFPHYQTGILLF